MTGPIHYFCTAEHSYTIGIYTEFYADRIASAIRILPYRSFPEIRGFGPGTFIFTDMDRLLPTALERVTEVADTLQEAGCRVLNHPRGFLGRFDLLRRLHQAGVNRFDVHRLAEWQAVRRFPVFIRHEKIHGSSITGLIETPEALGEAVGALREDQRAPDLMIVEFGNEPAADGRYRKYAAFRVGDEIYCQHCYASEDWWVKFTSSGLGEERRRELDDYRRANPHRDQLMAMFETAGLAYGRADYCVVDGKVQVFEINSNPTIIQRGAAKLIDVGRYARLHDEALRALALGGSGPAETPNPAFAGGRSLSLEQIHRRERAFFRSRWNPDDAPES